MVRHRGKRVIAIILFVIFFIPKVAIADTKKKDYKVIHKTNPVSVNKEWKIKFNKKVDSYTANSNNIWVEDDKDRKVSCRITLDKDKKEVTIRPSYDYTLGKEYHIVIEKDIKSEKGEKLKGNLKIYFNVNNVFAGLPYENGIIIVNDMAYSIDYLAKNARIKNEILNGSYNVYYCYEPTEQKIKDIIGNEYVNGSKNTPSHKEKIIYVDENGVKHTYEWNEEYSEYQRVAPSLDMQTVVSSNAKVITLKVREAMGIEGAAYYRTKHSNSMKKMGDTVIFTSPDPHEEIEVLSDNKNVLAKGTFPTNYNINGVRRVYLLNNEYYGNSAGNINNNGYASEDNEGYLYYNNTGDRNALYKLDTNGMLNKSINYDDAQYINVVNDWIYYSNYKEGGKLYRMKVDGTSQVKLSDDMAAYVTVYKDWIYYSNHSDGGRLYKIRTDGTKRGPVSSSLNSEVAYINLVGDWIYYTDINDRHRPYVINSDGTYISKLSDEWANSIQVVGDWIYYTSSTGVLSKLKKDGTGGIIPIKGQTREFDKGFHLNVVDNWLYYSNYLDGGKLYKIKTDGSGEKMKLTNETVDYINIVRDYIYYTVKGKLYRLPIDTDGNMKGEVIKKPGSGKNIMKIDDVKVTVSFSDVNLPLKGVGGIEDKYLPSKLPGILDDNTMHQFVVNWDTDPKRVSIRNGIRTYTGDVVGYNKKVKLELEIPSEMLNETNTIRIYNNPDKNNDVVVVENEFDNNLVTRPQKLNVGDVVNVYDSEDCKKLLSKGTVTREGRYNKATIQRLELDKYGQKSIWITVMRNGRSESKPTQVKMADIPTIIKAGDPDETGLGINGRDFEIKEWVPSVVDSPDYYEVYIVPSNTKLDFSKDDLKSMGSIRTRSSKEGRPWQGTDSMTKDSKDNKFRKGKYNIFVGGEFESTASSDSRGKRPKVTGYVVSEAYSIDAIEEVLPKKPTIKAVKVKQGDNIILNKAPAIGEIAWLIPLEEVISENSRVKGWISESGRSWPYDIKGSPGTAYVDNSKKIAWLIGDGQTKTMISPIGDKNKDNVQYKLMITNKVGASPESDYNIIVDDKPPVAQVPQNVSVKVGEQIRVAVDEKSKVYIIKNDPLIRLTGDPSDIDIIENAKATGYAVEFSNMRVGVPNQLLTDKVKGHVGEPSSTNYKIVVIDEAGNVTISKNELKIWVDITELDKVIKEAEDLLARETFSKNDESRLNNEISKAKSIKDNAESIVNTIVVNQRQIDSAAKSLRNAIDRIGAPLIIDYSISQGDKIGTTKISCTPKDGGKLYIKVQSSSISTPTRLSAVGGFSEYKGGDISCRPKNHIGLYQIDKNGRVVRFVDILVTEEDIKPEPPKDTTGDSKAP